MSDRHPISRATSLRALTVAALLAAGTVAGAQAPSPVLLVALRANKAMGALAFVDPATGKIVGRAPTGQDPHGVGVSADGKTAFVVNTSGPDGNSISVIDLATRKEVRRIQVPGARPHDIHVAAGKVYFTAQAYRSVGRYDPATQIIEWFGLGQQGPHSMAVSRDGNTIYAANADVKNVTIVEGASAPGWKVTVVPVSGEAEGIDISADGKEVWCSNGEKDGGISVIDVATKKVTHIPLKGVHNNRLQFTPDGKRAIVLDREGSEIIIVDTASRRELKRIKPKAAAGTTVDVNDTAFMPDSSRAYVSVSSTTGGGNYIAVIDMKTLAVTGEIVTPIGADEMAWVGK